MIDPLAFPLLPEYEVKMWLRTGWSRFQAERPGWFTPKWRAAVVTGEAACLMSAKELAKERAAAENAGLLALATAQAAGVAAMPTFEVEVAEARSLMAADKNGKSDPYAVVELVADAGGKALKGESFKTKTHKKTLDPKFGERFTLGAATEDAELAAASLRVRPVSYTHLTLPTKA